MCHHGKEKGLKFPAMEGVGIPKENRPIGQMLFEHAEGRMYILYQMTESTDNDVFDKNIFTQSLTMHIILLRVHIDK